MHRTSTEGQRAEGMNDYITLMIKGASDDHILFPSVHLFEFFALLEFWSGFR